MGANQKVLDVMYTRSLFETEDMARPKIEKKKFTFIDLFSGIGGFRVALQALKGESLGFSEIDNYAIETYRLNYSQDPINHGFGDVTKITNLPKVDVLVGGVPCQSWSVAGKMKGFEDPRGRLWFDTIQMVEQSKPKVFIFENVKGLADPRNAKNLELIVEHFKKLKYTVTHQVLNTYDFGLPQNRSRIFIVGFRHDQQHFAKKFAFLSAEGKSVQLVQFLENVERKSIVKKKLHKDDLFGGKVPMSRNASQKDDELNDFFVLCDTRNGHTSIHSWDIKATSQKEKKICMAIMRNRRKSKYGEADGNPLSFENIKELVPDLTKTDIDGLVAKKILRYTASKMIDIVNSKNSSGIDGIYRVYLPNSTIFSTLTATGTRDFIATKYVEGKTVAEYKKNFIEEILKKKNYRQVSVREALTIQGFPKNHKITTKEKYAFKQVGNSVSPVVVEKVFNQTLKTGIFK